jgi:hypothetical protein
MKSWALRPAVFLPAANSNPRTDFRAKARGARIQVDQGLTLWTTAGDLQPSAARLGNSVEASSAYKPACAAGAAGLDGARAAGTQPRTPGRPERGGPTLGEGPGSPGL